MAEEPNRRGGVHRARHEAETSWFEDRPQASLGLTGATGAERDAAGLSTCSGLPVARNGAALLSERLGMRCRLVKSLNHDRRTPWGSVQRFHFRLFRKS